MQGEATAIAPGKRPLSSMSPTIVGAPSLGGKQVGNNRYYGANDPRRNTGLAAGF